MHRYCEILSFKLLQVIFDETVDETVDEAVHETVDASTTQLKHQKQTSHTDPT